MDDVATTKVGREGPGEALPRYAWLVGGWSLLAVDALLCMVSILGHERAAEALTSRLSWSVMPDDPGIARFVGTWTGHLVSLGLAAQTLTVWLAMRWRRWRLEPAGTPRNHVAMAVLLVALLWNLGSAVGVLFTSGGGGAEVAESVRESVLGWRGLLDLANAGMLVAAWRWRPWRRPSGGSPDAIRSAS
jgi:hypothetical protein